MTNHERMINHEEKIDHEKKIAHDKQETYGIFVRCASSVHDNTDRVLIT